MLDARAGARRTVLRCGLAALLVTALCVVLPVQGPGAEPSLGTALDSAAAPVAALLAYLFYGRFRLDRMLADAVMCAYLLVLATSNLLLSALPRALDQPWGAGDRTALAGALAAVMYLSGVRLGTRRWAGGVGAGAALVVGSAAVAVLVAQLAGPLLSQGGMVSPLPAGRLVTATQLLAAGLFLVGVLSFLSGPRPDPLMALLAGSAVLAAASRIAAVMSATANDGWSTAGLLLRVAGYVVLVVAAAQEIGNYWQRMAQVAALEERQRLSRDLHDGIAQDLAFAAGQARILARCSDHPDRARMIIAASERALDECRHAIAALTRPLDEPLHVALAQCAEQLCDRFQTRLDLDLDASATVDAQAHQSLVRIVREAVSNAGRHGGAARVAVRLHQDDGLLLEVEDDGVGFDPAAVGPAQGRFGLVSMQERAEALGGTFRVGAGRHGGTRVEVRLP